ncbi:hypothetical protein D3C81_1479330 [compost metagenome]
MKNYNDNQNGGFTVGRIEFGPKSEFFDLNVNKQFTFSANNQDENLNQLVNNFVVSLIQKGMINNLDEFKSLINNFELNGDSDGK